MPEYVKVILWIMLGILGFLATGAAVTVPKLIRRKENRRRKKSRMKRNS